LITTMASAGPNPEHIIHTASSFMSCKVLQTAVKFRLFDLLERKESKDKQGLKWLEIGTELKWNTKVETGGDRSSRDFLDTLVALHFLNRTGNGPDSKYHNTPDCALFLTTSSPASLVSAIEGLFDRLYTFWNTLDDGLVTGKPQNEIKTEGKSLFDKFSEDPASFEKFLKAMVAMTKGRDSAMAEKIDFSKYKAHLDLGGGLGSLSVILTSKHAHIKSTTFDLPAASNFAKKFVTEHKADAKVAVLEGDMFKDGDKLPKVDVMTGGFILHDWSLAKKKQILKTAFNALNAGGAFIALEHIIDDERRVNVPGLLMSLNMLIETGAGQGFDYSFEEFQEWAKEAGFARCEKVHLIGPAFAAIAHKA